MALSDGFDRLVSHLASRPSSTILWGSPHEVKEDEVLGRFYSSWVDVYVPDVIEACGFNWVWTVESVADRSEDWGEPSFFTLDVGYDLTVSAVWDPFRVERTSPDGSTWYEPGDVLFLATPVGTPLSPAQEATLATVLAGGPGRSVRSFGGWREGTLNAAIRSWCQVHVGRDFEVSFELDQPLSGHAAVAAQTLSCLAAGEDETYLIGVGEGGVEIQASAQAFEALAELGPEDAAEAMAFIQRLAAVPPPPDPA